MLPLVLVLLVATCALAAPSQVYLDLKYENEISQNSLTSAALSSFDGGDLNVYTLNAQEILKDLAQSQESQAQAFGQTLAILGELSTGRPGDVCVPATLINSYASGNPGIIRRALGNYIQQLTSNIDNFVKYKANPESVRYATGSRGGCSGEGRTYQLDEAWEKILASTSPNQIRLINEEYCTAKRLYYSFNARSNNVGAHLTASALPPVVQIFQAANGALSNLIEVIASGRSPVQAAQAAKSALNNALRKVRL